MNSEKQRSVNLYMRNFGCKTNFSDLFSILGRIRKSNEIKITDMKESDIVILNSCSVTKDAEKELNKWIRKAKREGKKVIVTGCLPNLKKIADADLSIGSGNYNKISPEILQKLINEKTENKTEIRLNGLILDNSIIEDDVDFYDYESFPRSRAYLKIQEGCDKFCTFCSIPLTRGLPRFVSEEKVISKIKEFIERNFKEIVLVGTHLALYGKNGKNTGELNLGRLVKKIAKEFQGEKIKLRFSSLSPKEIDEQMLEGLELGKNIFCPHFHISVQSGSNRILKLMRRWHTFEDFINDSEKLLKLFPDACIGTDIIVGFPGETDKDFEETLRNIQSSEVGHIHVFPFSPRPKTPAFFMRKVPEKEINERVKTMLKIANEKREKFFRRFVGKTLETLVEDVNGKIEGTTPNYINVLIENPSHNNKTKIEKGQILPCTIKDVKKNESKIYATAEIAQTE